MNLDQEEKTALPPLLKIISPNQTHLALNNMQQLNNNNNINNNNNNNSQYQLQNQQLNSLYYQSNSNNLTNNNVEPSVLRSINDYSNTNSNSNINTTNNNNNSNINHIRNTANGTNSPTQYSLSNINTNNNNVQLDNLDSSDYLKSRQSPLIPGYYQHLQTQYDYRTNHPPPPQQQRQVLMNQLNNNNNNNSNSNNQLQNPYQNDNINNNNNIINNITNIPSKCTCKQNDSKRIPRPRNAFILFRQKHHLALIEEGNQVKSNPEVSKELGRRWRALEPAEKDYWNNLAEEEKRLHAEKYPGYKYTPKRNSKKKCDYCIYKQNLKQQMAEQAAKRKAEKEQKRLEKHYQHQLMQQRQQQKQLLKQQQLQQKQKQKQISNVNVNYNHSNQLIDNNQQQHHHHHQQQQTLGINDFSDQFSNPTLQNSVFNDMNLSNYQKFSQQIIRTSSSTNSQPSNPFYGSNINQNYQSQNNQVSQIPPYLKSEPYMVSSVQQQQQQQQHYSNNNNSNNSNTNSNNNNSLLSNLNNRLHANQHINYPTNVSSSSSTIGTSTTNNSVFTNQINPSRVATPVDYASFDQKQQQQQQQLQQNNDPQLHNQTNTLPSINDLSLPPLNLNQ